MEYLILGFFTGLSLILAIGAQNIFVIEHKREGCGARVTGGGPRANGSHV